MAIQSLYFLSDTSARAEFEIEHEAEGVLSLVASFNPRRDDEGVSAYPGGDEMADAIEAKVKEHFGDNGARLTRIRYRHDPRYVTIEHLARFGVPLLPEPRLQ
jgi:hypothetical protein